MYFLSSFVSFLIEKNKDIPPELLLRLMHRHTIAMGFFTAAILSRLVGNQSLYAPSDFPIVSDLEDNAASPLWGLVGPSSVQQYESRGSTRLNLSAGLNEPQVSVQYVEQPQQNESPSVFSQATLKDRQCGPQRLTERMVAHCFPSWSLFLLFLQHTLSWLQVD